MVVRHYLPMVPTLVREPFHGAGWVYEEKVDGWRIPAYKDGDRVRLVGRHGVDHTKRFRGIGENALLAPRGFGVAPTPWRAVQRAAWQALRRGLNAQVCAAKLPC